MLLSKKAEKVFFMEFLWTIKMTSICALKNDFENSNICFCRVEAGRESFSAQGEISQLTSAMLHAVVFIFSHPLKVPCSSMIQV